MSCMAAVLDVLHKKLIDKIFFIARQQRQLLVTLHLKHKTKTSLFFPKWWYTDISAFEISRSFSMMSRARLQTEDDCYTLDFLMSKVNRRYRENVTFTYLGDRCHRWIGEYFQSEENQSCHISLCFYFTLERKNDLILKKTLRMKRICNKQKRAIIWAEETRKSQEHRLFRC